MKKILSSCLKIGVSGGLIYLLFNQKDLSINDVFYQISHANINWFLFGVLLFSTSTILGALQWRMLMQAREINIPVRKAISYYYVGLFFNNFLPGYVAGDAFRIYDITKTSGKNSDAVSTVLLDRLVGFVVLTTLALFASLIWMYSSNRASFFFYVIIIIFAGWMLALTLLFNLKLAQKIQWIFEKLLPVSIVQKIKAIYLGINSFKHHKSLLIKTLFISIVIQGLRVLTHFAAACSIGLTEVGVIHFFIFIPIVALAVTIPISIGGFGIREQTAVYLFALPGVGGNPDMITSMEFMAYLIGILCSLPGGIIFILRRQPGAVQLERT